MKRNEYACPFCGLVKSNETDTCSGTAEDLKHPKDVAVVPRHNAEGAQPTAEGGGDKQSPGAVAPPVAEVGPQRYGIYGHKGEIPSADGEYVRYADHASALQASERRPLPEDEGRHGPETWVRLPQALVEMYRTASHETEDLPDGIKAFLDGRFGAALEPAAGDQPQATSRRP